VRGVCPRCGRPAWIYPKKKGSNIYFEAVHVEDRTTCYLGPEVYKYVSVTHDLDLKGALEPTLERVLAYLKDAVVMLEENMEEELRKVKDVERVYSKALEVEAEVRRLLHLLRRVKERARATGGSDAEDKS